MKSNDTPRIPDAAWLEQRLGEGSLWRPDEAGLPVELTDAQSREFLLTVGFPAVRLDVVRIDTRHVRDEGGLEPFDADEIYGNRYPDDDSPPKNFCFTVATRYDQHLMLEAADGGITHYDPNGWDHADGWQGPAADSLPRLAVLLGLIAESGRALESADEAVRAAAVTDLRERMIDLDSDVDESGFWGEVFEGLG
ncbi:SUKH-4 family immunity protein [Streptomyces sp. 4503]|uniref:SUKH-4 family immunity protein n=1 Tax=Streptomyces niphimycinicus TaxID=2842201 RepID=A0ABS6C965_9ACTN|nr:SUKH-4 family immunity protein [Streptomyces niphimycinicus]MBU3863439.1 SUKH-4 family immunity protein [Streptomyces niphimycinicus]